MIILGIDPGTTRVGYGVIKKDGRRLSLLSAGILGTDNKEKTLLDIKNELGKITKKFKPATIAIEKLFFSKNQKTAIRVAEARGVIILHSLENKIRMEEYSPNEVKLGVTGYGFADKKAILNMVGLILGEHNLRVIDDASDALALAIFAANKSGR